MNGGHDLGGMQGLGPIAPEPDEPVFHADWERRAFALTLAMGMHGRWNIDRSRYVRENRHPVDYLSSTYYELWQKALERLAVEENFVTADEIETGRPLQATRQAKAVPVDDAMRRLGLGTDYTRPLATPPRFAAGDRVRVKDTMTVGHTRAPRYCRGRAGTIHAVHGGFVFPDSSAAGRGDKPQPLYAVRFAAQDLWGEQANARDAVFLDLWDDYLVPA
ncbi:MAG: nitrile hydratase subunit beta [Alphaproteobacteria bacterium]|nr:nitrile hydratase subunit beta [Alphaproteobacteria bacterium]